MAARSRLSIPSFLVPKKRRNTKATAAVALDVNTQPTPVEIVCVWACARRAWENLDETFEEVFFDWLAAENAPKRPFLLSGQPTTATFREATRAIGAAVARFLDTEEVTGSNPVSPTKATTSKPLVPQGASMHLYLYVQLVRGVRGTKPGTSLLRQSLKMAHLAPCAPMLLAQG